MEGEVARLLDLLPRSVRRLEKRALGRLLSAAHEAGLDDWLLG